MKDVYVPLFYQDNLYRWLLWANRVDNMSGFEIPKGYEAPNSTNEYDRFVGFFKDWTFTRIISTYKEKDLTGPEFTRIATEDIFADIALDKRVDDRERFWKDAISSRGNKRIKASLPSMKQKSDSHKESVYNLFLPAYRALKDSFDRRSIWQWFTNHSQYTAERDSIRALEGVMRSLTGDSFREVTQKLNTMRDRMPERNWEACMNAEKERLRSLEPEKYAQKDNIIRNNTKVVEHIIIEDLNNNNIIASGDPITPSEPNVNDLIK